MKEGLAPRLVLEVASLKMARWEDLASIDDLLARLESRVPIASGPARAAAPARPPVSTPPSPARETRSWGPVGSPSPPPAAPAGPQTPTLFPVRQAQASFGPVVQPVSSPPSVVAAATAAPADAPPSSPPPAVPVPPGTAAPAADGGSDDAAPAPIPPDASEFKARWPGILEKVRISNVYAAAFLKEAHPVSLEGAEMTIAFPAGMRFHKTQIEMPKHRKSVEDAAQAELGVSVALHCTIAAGGEAAPAAGGAAPPSTPPPADVLADPGVKRVMQIFDGRVVDVKRPQ
jgi:hypothetical protein